MLKLLLNRTPRTSVDSFNMWTTITCCSVCNCLCSCWAIALQSAQVEHRFASCPRRVRLVSGKYGISTFSQFVTSQKSALEDSKLLASGILMRTTSWTSVSAPSHLQAFRLACCRDVLYTTSRTTFGQARECFSGGPFGFSAGKMAASPSWNHWPFNGPYPALVTTWTAFRSGNCIAAHKVASAMNSAAQESCLNDGISSSTAAPFENTKRPVPGALSSFPSLYKSSNALPFKFTSATQGKLLTTGKREHPLHGASSLASNTQGAASSPTKDIAKSTKSPPFSLLLYPNEKELSHCSCESSCCWCNIYFEVHVYM